MTGIGGLVARPWGLGNMILFAAALVSYLPRRGNVVKLRIGVSRYDFAES